MKKEREGARGAARELKEAAAARRGAERLERARAQQDSVASWWDADAGQEEEGGQASAASAARRPKRPRPERPERGGLHLVSLPMATVLLRPACVLHGCGGEGARCTEAQARGGGKQTAPGKHASPGKPSVRGSPVRGKSELPGKSEPANLGKSEPRSTALRCTRCGTVWQSSWWASYLEKARHLEKASHLERASNVERASQLEAAGSGTGCVETGGSETGCAEIAEAGPSLEAGPSGGGSCDGGEEALPKDKGSKQLPKSKPSDKGPKQLPRSPRLKELQPAAASPRSKAPSKPPSPLPRSPRLKELHLHPAGKGDGKELRISRNLQQLQDHNMAGPEDDAPNTFMPSRAAARCAPMNLEGCAPMNLLPPPPPVAAAAIATAKAKGGKAIGASFGCPRCRWAPRGCDRCQGEGEPGRRVRPRT